MDSSVSAYKQFDKLEFAVPTTTPRYVILSERSESKDLRIVFIAIVA